MLFFLIISNCKYSIFCHALTKKNSWDENSIWLREENFCNNIGNVCCYFFPFQELESINEDVQAMSSCCQDMTSRLQVLDFTIVPGSK